MEETLTLLEGFDLLVLILIAIAIVGVVFFERRDKWLVQKYEAEKKQKPPIREVNPTAIVYVKNVDLGKVRKGYITGIFGFVLTAALLLLYVTTSDYNVLQAGMINNAITLTGIAALVAFFGVCCHDASCMLLSAIALVAATISDINAIFGLFPAIFLLISHFRMKELYYVDIEKELLRIKKEQKEEKNKTTFDTVEQAESKGYQPCQNCSPQR